MLRAKVFGVALLALAAGCTTQRPQRAPAPTRDVLSTPDATPRPVRRAARGNPPFYDVLGKRYFVMDSADGFVERGVASWYGPGFHKGSTSIGDPYDMYAMTAAHKTLPLPCYARVTNLTNGRSVVVYINDRGPFKDGRIVDLSYAAATKLDMTRAGTALVELRVLSADGASGLPAYAAAPSGPLYVQAGAFKEEQNARRLLERLRDSGYASAFLLREPRRGDALYRVRIGPVASVQEFDRVVERLKSLGVADAHLATVE